LIEALLREIRDECSRHGARFALAFRGWPDEIDSPILGPLQAAAPAAEDPYCLGSRLAQMGPEMLAPMARRLDIPYLDLTASLQAAVKRAGKSHHFSDDNHYNTLGHAAAGAALAEFVESLVDEPRPAPGVPAPLP
jgi:hypothetical protein